MIYSLTILSVCIVGCGFYSLPVQATTNAVCNHGPIYYCNTIKQSLECGKLDHCINQHWPKSAASVSRRNLKLPSTSFKCTICEYIMTDLKNLLLQNRTEEVIINDVNAFCDEIKSENVNQVCKLLSGVYLKPALKMLSNDIHPRVVCQTLELCDEQSAYIPKTLAAVIRLLPSFKAANGNTTVECQDCKTFMTDVRKRLTSNVTKYEVERAIDAELCSKLPNALRDPCTTIVKQSVDQLTEMFAQKMRPEVECTILGFCNRHLNLAILNGLNALYSQYPVALPDKIKYGQCEICDAIRVKTVAVIKTKLTEEEKLEQFKNIVRKELCINLPAIESKCSRWVQLYGNLLFFGIQANPKYACEDLMQQCVSKPPTNKLVTHKNTPKLKETGEVRKDIQLQPIDNVKLSLPHLMTPCEICKIILGVIEKKLPPIRTEVVVQRLLEEACEVLPSKYEVKCAHFVDQYGAKIIAELVDFAVPTAICASIGVCPLMTIESPKINKVVYTKNEKALIQKEFQTVFPNWRHPRHPKSMSCDLCKFVVQQVDSAMKRNATESEVVAELSALCAHLPDSYKQMCQDYVKNYVPRIMKILAQDVAPEVACQQLGLCGSSLVGGNKCTYGPSYWCQSREIARGCNAEAHCESRVWNKAAQIKPVVEI